MDSKPKLLLVDDEKHFVESLRSILEHYEYNCTIALNGKEAINCLKQKHFELALLDVGLPDISGCDIAEFIKTSCRDTTSVMLTGMNTVEIAVKAMKHGAYDFLSKPIDHSQLIKVINKSLEHNSLRKELRVSDERFKTLAEVAWEGIVIERSGQLLDANRQFFTMFGYEAGELIHKGFLNTIFTPDAFTTISSYFDDNSPHSFELTGVKKGGAEICVQAKTSLIHYLGKPARVMILRDMSDRVKHEQEKLELQNKLAKASKLNALGLMAGSVAHDLNNILTAVVSYPDLLLMQMNESDRYYIEIKKIQEAGKQAAAVVSDLVSIARGSVRKTVVAELNAIISKHLRSIEHSERLFKFPNTFIQTQLQQDLQPIECSPQHIRKLLLNLIGNALESVGEYGVVRIETKNHTIARAIKTDLFTLEPGNYVKLTISDNGPGIAPQDIDNIFTPFYTTKDKEKSGTGLGLSIVWNVVQEHRGWIDVENLHPGVAFEIYLPATDKPIKTQENIAIHESIRGHGEQILLVDDQSEQNNIMEEMLNILGYKTASVTSGEEAIVYLKKNNADLVILDMMMGDGINGRETYQRIIEIRPNQRAMIVSGFTENEEVELARDLGIRTFIEKPVGFTRIGKAIKESLTQY